jgi:hypothetical protein
MGIIPSPLVFFLSNLRRSSENATCIEESCRTSRIGLMYGLSGGGGSGEREISLCGKYARRLACHILMLRISANGYVSADGTMERWTLLTPDIKLRAS